MLNLRKIYHEQNLVNQIDLWASTWSVLVVVDFAQNKTATVLTFKTIAARFVCWRLWSQVTKLIKCMKMT